MGLSEYAELPAGFVSAEFDLMAADFVSEYAEARAVTVRTNSSLLFNLLKTRTDLNLI